MTASWQKRATREDVERARQEVSAFMRETGCPEKRFARFLSCSAATLYNLLHTDKGAYVPTLQLVRAAITDLRQHPEKLQRPPPPKPKPEIVRHRSGHPMAPDMDDLRARAIALKASGVRVADMQKGAHLGQTVIFAFMNGRKLTEKSAKKLRAYLDKQEHLNGSALVHQPELPFVPPKAPMRIRAVVDVPPHPSHETSELVTSFINKMGMEAIQTLLRIAQSIDQKEGE
jgi:hypothetical protein